ncbi:MAG: hypothetical protein EZS28_053541, partial [Streblomastix strix]
MVQTYDNNSVVCAGGGVKAISDITSNYYNKSETYSQTETNNLLNNKVNTGVSYTKGEDDALLLLKVDKTQLIDSYIKRETNNLLNSKADSGVSYTKGEDDALLLLKADKTQLIDSYSKTEDDALLLLKADKTDLNNFVDLTSAQTVSGQKQFGEISVSSISKQSKNDASILLAGGGDMLVSTLVNQTELQEVRDIATGKSKGYVFATTDEMNTWMEDQENIAKL